MKRTIPYKVQVIFALALVFAMFASDRIAYGADRTCYDDWSAAGKHIEREALVPVKDIRKLAGEKLKGALLKIKLCSEAERYVYQLVLFAPDGKVRKLSVDAKKPEF